LKHKSGFVNIIGNPNAGKSTLMNALVGEKVSIITSKAQTTRHRILGIVNGDDFQIVYSDTPGLLKPSYKLQEAMMEAVEGAFSDADVFLLVIDVKDKNDPDPAALERIRKSGMPVIVVLNKTDLIAQEKLFPMADRWIKEFPKGEVIPVSALKGRNIDRLFELIMKHLPEHPAYFDKGALTDRTMRFFVSEIIREKIFLNYEQEIPYAAEVYIDTYEESPNLDKIRAIILVERESQKGIILGNKGEAIKRMGTAARKDIEEFTEKKCFLELFVKVDEDWRNDQKKVKRYGY
jgi:GTPase